MMTLGTISGWSHPVRRWARGGVVACAMTLALGLTGAAQAQDPPNFTAGPLKFQGYVDGYYSLNFNHPATRNNGFDRYFDIQANQFSLNMAGLYTSMDADPVGFTLQLGFGRGWDIFHGAEPNGGRDIVRLIPQAYLTVKPKSWGGATLDFGKFVTSAEAELTETHLGWNYSRSLLYSNGPFYHFGARLTKPVNDHWTVGAHLINGWNNVEDNNSAKTVGLTSAITGKKVALYNTYYGGREVSSGPGARHFIDTVLTFTPNDKVTGYLTYDYGRDKGDYGLDRGTSTWWGANAAVKFQLNDNWATAFRYDFYNDIDGLITGGARQHEEFTSTVEYKLSGTGNFVMRGEYRYDWASTPFFDRGNEPGSATTQSTALVGFVAYFGF